MEKQFKVSLDGHEFGLQDVNLIAENAAQAGDRLLADLAQSPAFNYATGASYIGILPLRNKGVGGNANNGNLVETTGNTTGSPGGLRSRVNPFRAIVSHQMLGEPVADPKLSHRTIYTALHAGSGTNPYTDVLHLGRDATLPRWDLVYAEVSVNVYISLPGAPIRVFKDAGGNVGATSLDTEVQSSVRLLVSNGTPSAAPVRPGVPANTALAVYIPLAYVWIDPLSVDSSTFNISRLSYQGCAPIVALPGETLRPSTFNSNLPMPLGADKTPTTPFPDTWLPPEMVGKEERLFIVSSDDIGPVNSRVLVDDSIDWSNRFLKITAQFQYYPVNAGIRHDVASQRDVPDALDGGHVLPTMQVGFNPNFMSRTIVGMGSTFESNGNSNYGQTCRLEDATDPGWMFGASGAVGFWVQDKKLYFDNYGVPPRWTFFLWVEASARFTQSYRGGNNGLIGPA